MRVAISEEVKKAQQLPRHVHGTSVPPAAAPCCPSANTHRHANRGERFGQRLQQQGDHIRPRRRHALSPGNAKSCSSSDARRSELFPHDRQFAERQQHFAAGCPTAAPFPSYLGFDVPDDQGLRPPQPTARGVTQNRVAAS